MQLTPTRFLRVHDVAVAFGVNVSMVWHCSRSGRLPKPHKICPRIIVSRADAIAFAVAKAVMRGGAQ